MAWLYVLIASVFEVVWVSGLKHASSPLEWGATAVGIAVSLDLLIRASKQLPVGTVYAVFTGLGTAGTVLTEMFVFDAPVAPLQLALLGTLLLGVIGLKVVGGES